jgi:predicted ATPase
VSVGKGLAAQRATGSEEECSYFLALLAESYWNAGDMEAGLRMLEEAMSIADKAGEHCYEAELYRLKGLLLLGVGNNDDYLSACGDEAEGCFRKAIELARHQGARTLELRAVSSLARLWQREGKIAGARQTLSEVYNWFTEGYDTVDLREAKALLDELLPIQGNHQRDGR